MTSDIKVGKTKPVELTASWHCVVLDPVSLEATANISS